MATQQTTSPRFNLQSLITRVVTMVVPLETRIEFEGEYDYKHFSEGKCNHECAETFLKHRFAYRVADSLRLKT